MSFKTKEQKIAYDRAYYLAHKEKINAANNLRASEHREEASIYNKEWREINKEKIKAHNKLYYKEHREEVLEDCKTRYWENPEKHRAQSRKNSKVYNLTLRHAALDQYGGKCACCGETTFEFLAIDHINGGGGKHRKEINRPFNRWLKQNNYPAGFQILCHNCNMAKGIYGKCPHKEIQKHG